MVSGGFRFYQLRFWVGSDGFGWVQMVSGGFEWFRVVSGFINYAHFAIFTAYKLSQVWKHICRYQINIKI